MHDHDEPADPRFHYHLPSELIAQDPAERRDESRLLRVARDRGVLGEVRFRRLPDLLRAGDLLVVNDSRVFPARLRLRRCPTGGRLELLLVRPDASGCWLALARPARRLRPGQLLELDPGGDADRAAESDAPAEETAGPLLEISAVLDDGYVTVACADVDPADVARRWGEVPLPAYIKRQYGDPRREERRRRDRERYQTVYARHEGSVAAPTAGLHFADATVAALHERGVAVARLTLHVGPGTFRTPSSRQIELRRLHEEWFHCPAAVMDAVSRARNAGGRVVAVGTTTLRVLETVHRLRLDSCKGDSLTFGSDGADRAPVFSGNARRSGSGWDVSGTTRLFLRPPDEIESVDGLLTNFHLPGSSLIMLVAAFAGEGVWHEAYRHAVKERFRFYSYGDAMLIMGADAER